MGIIKFNRKKSQFRVVHGLGRSMGWVGSNFLDFCGLGWVELGWELGRVVLMFIFKVIIILQHKKCILLLYSPD